MKKLIGSEIVVYLKSSDSSLGDVFGLMIDTDDESIYLQGLGMTPSKIYAVPKCNVKYCTAAEAALHIDDSITTSRLIAEKSMEREEIIQEPASDNTLDVFVNKELIVSIPVPPTFKLAEFNDNIMKVIMGNPDVHYVLKDMVQESIDYYPGKVYINAKAIQVEPQGQYSQQNTFAMSSGGPGSGDISKQFFNPSQMITRLNSSLKKKV
jgi:hypothetical protein